MRGIGAGTIGANDNINPTSGLSLNRGSVCVYKQGHGGALSNRKISLGLVQAGVIFQNSVCLCRFFIMTQTRDEKT